MEVLYSFGEWLRQRREALRLTRAELADCAGCSVSALRKIEADERRPSRQLAELLAGCLHLAPEEQPAFVDAARGVRQVAHLGSPEPGAQGWALSQPLAGSPAGDSAAHSAPLWNLPAPATPLIGREAELETLVRLLDDPQCRLLTLLGPGGIGKTRLALEAACAVWDRFGHGVFFVPLEATASAEFMAPAIAQAIGVNFAGSAEPRQQLVNVLRHKQALLFLDNMEHLLHGVDLLAEILEQAPEVKLLVTSRERLQLRGEWGFDVQGLPTPAEEQAQGLENYSAVQLFLQRARRVCVDFEPSEEDNRNIVHICRLVEGMPLALEFAAAWASVLSCREIAGEIERGLDILATSLRDVPERQRSMHAVFDHSWNLLSAEEQRVLRQLSVFSGGFRREAARVVADADLVLLSSLSAKSFLRHTSRGRFLIHDLVRQYAAGRLARNPDEEQATCERHATYYMDFVAGLEDDLKGARQHEALMHMDDEAGNVRRAWRRAVQRGDATNVRKAIRALWYFYDIRGWFQEAQAAFCWAADTLEQRVASGEDLEADVAILHAYIRAQQAWFGLRVGRFEEAEQLLEVSLAVLRAAGAHERLVDALQHAGALQRLMGNYVRSRDLYQEMYHYAAESGDSWNATIAEGDIGLAAQALGDNEEAYKHMAATVVSFRQLGDPRMLAVALHFLGGISRAMESYDEAGRSLRESLALSRSIGDRWIESMTLRELGNVARELGTRQCAACLFKDSLAVAREIGEHWCILQALTCLGDANLALDDLAAAHDAFHEALTMAWEMQALPDVLAALEGLAAWSARQATSDEKLQADLTTTLFVLNHPAVLPQTKEAARRLQSELEKRLESHLVEAAQAHAQTLSLESIVASEAPATRWQA